MRRWLWVTVSKCSTSDSTERDTYPGVVVVVTVAGFQIELWLASRWLK